MLSGTLNAEEQQQISHMMDDPDFRELFDAVLDQQGGELDMTVNDQSLAFTSEKLQVFHQLTHQASSDIVMESPVEDIPVVKLSPWKRLLPYAAAIMVAIGGLLVWWSGANEKQRLMAAQELNKKNEQLVAAAPAVQYTEHYNPKSRRLRVKLPDGSSITLGSKSRLKYPATFAVNKRDVYLEGEAFFEVTKDAAKPFVVYTGNVRTLVLGTSFKVSALPNTSVEVAVVTGKVQVSYHNGNTDNNLATMLPGEKITWEHNQLARLKFDPRDVLAWKNEQMVFRKQTLKNILDVFQRHYGVHISVINKGFLTERISLSMDEKMPLEKAMNVLAGTAGFEHAIDSLSRTVIIK
ncbi:hypothetical protein CK934_01025 [Chitinophaga sp. MD30]|nr:hypothetical protein CK934_01025 [Chitinophaga sp. MD30]